MIRQHHQPESPEDIVRVLAPLSEPVLQSVIEEKSKAMDLAWLNVMLEQDLLDMEDITLWAQLPVASIEDVTEAWGRRIEAFLGFVGNGQLVEQRQPLAGRPDVVHQLAVLEAPDAFKAWFDRAAALVVAEHCDSIGRMTGPLGTDAQQGMTLTLAKWTAAACLLDRPRVVEKMLALDEKVAEALLDVAALKLLLATKEKEGLTHAQWLFWGSSGPSFGQAMAKVLEKNMDKLLIGLMDAGIVEPRKAEPGHKSAMDMAKAANSPMVAVMASWTARRTAHSLIDEIGLSPFKIKTKS